MNRGLDLTDEAHNRTMRDFLELFNKITHHCFDKCISNFNQRNVTSDEGQCVTTCTEKYLHFNQRHMLIFMEHQTNKQKMAIKAAESAAVQAETEATTAVQGTASATQGEANSEALSNLAQVTSSAMQASASTLPSSSSAAARTTESSAATAES